MPISSSRSSSSRYSSRSSSGSSSRGYPSSSSSSMINGGYSNTLPKIIPKEENKNTSNSFSITNPIHPLNPARGSVSSSRDKEKEEEKSSSFSSQSGGFFTAIKEGFGLGLGSSIANQVVDRASTALFGARKIEVIQNHGDKLEKGEEKIEKVDKFDRCHEENEKYLECLKDKNQNLNSCLFQYEILDQCKSRVDN